MILFWNCMLVVITLGIDLGRSGVLASTCLRRCDQTSVDESQPCQCNSHCTSFQDCCHDYTQRCRPATGTCLGRCDQTSVDESQPCQCNSHCTSFQDCCHDYTQRCRPATVASAAGRSAPEPIPVQIDPRLNAVMTNIWNSDVSRFVIGLDVTINETGARLFTWVNETRLLEANFQSFISLLDNYARTIGTPELLLPNDVREQQAFLNILWRSEAMQLARAFLISQGKVTNGTFRSLVKELWFNFYPRSPRRNTTLDSSGFEHVMVGEIKGTAKVSGFHSWIQFYLQEKAGNLQYDTMVSSSQPNVKGPSFTWLGANKGKGSFFLGTSPEYDIAVYTICALMHPNRPCNFDVQGNLVSIQTWDIGHKAGYQIGSAYPAI